MSKKALQDLFIIDQVGGVLGPNPGKAGSHTVLTKKFQTSKKTRITNSEFEPKIQN